MLRLRLLGTIAAVLGTLGGSGASLRLMAYVSTSCAPVGAGVAPSIHHWVNAGFGDLYAAQYRPMVRLAQALVDTVENAEEIVQQAFVRVYERWDRLDNAKAYLRTAVVNGARSELRKREVRRRIGVKIRPPEAPGERDYLLDALDRLNERRRTALVLRFYADMSEQQIAQAMGVRPGTVKSLVSRGLADLRRVVKP